MTENGIIGLILIVANVAISYKGFNDSRFFDKYKFEVDKILINREYIRLISSGFLHVDWIHLAFNMLSLYLFSGLIENGLSWISFLIIYFTSLIGGDLLALFINKNNGDYSAVGASGAISGLIFACIALFPGIGIGFFGLGFFIPSWIYGILYVAYSIYGIKSKKDSIGHEAHLGGALIGMLVAIALKPSAFAQNYILILVILIPIIIFIYIIATRPQFLIIDGFKTHKKPYTIEDRYNENKVNKQKEIDAILEKIHKKGMTSLSAKEKQTLEEHSKR